MPYPLLLTKKALEKLGSGQMLKVLCDAPASAEDSIPRYAEKQGYTFRIGKTRRQEHVGALHQEIVISDSVKRARFRASTL